MFILFFRLCKRDGFIGKVFLYYVGEWFGLDSNWVVESIFWMKCFFLLKLVWVFFVYFDILLNLYLDFNKFILCLSLVSNFERFIVWVFFWNDLFICCFDIVIYYDIFVWLDVRKGCENELSEVKIKFRRCWMDMYEVFDMK